MSRTPVREALMRLEREGLLHANAGRGFFVKPLSVQEMRNTFPVLWTLEAQALRDAAPLTATRRVELSRINRALKDEKDPERCIDLDGAWHRTLLETCGNGYLMGLVAAAKGLIRRYQYAYMQTAGCVPPSTRTHEQIVALVAAGSVAEAALMLENDWRSTLQILVEWLHDVI